MSSEHDTFPKLLLRNARKYGCTRTAYRDKDAGIWQARTWQDLYESVKSLALGLAQLGLQRGETVCFIGDNRPEYVWGILAVQSLGGKMVGIFQDSLPREVEYVINHIEARIIFVEDQEQVDKMLDLRDKLPKVIKLIVDDWKGLRSYNNPLLMRLTDVQNLGREKEVEMDGFFEASIEQGRGEEIALISYTSGTTGVPKGAVLTYDNVLSMAESLEQVVSINETDSIVTYLPLAWIVEVMMSIGWFLRNGLTINFPENSETVQDNIREIGPTILLAVPRVWERMCSELRVKMLDADWLKRLGYDICLKKGEEMVDRKFGKSSGKGLSFSDKIIDKILYYSLFRPLKDRLGLLNVKHAFTGGSALGPDVFRFFQACAVNIKQIYGQTEMGGIIATHVDGDVDYETVGAPIPGCDIRIADTGEILCKGQGMFQGYYKEPEKTSEVKDEDGWLHTGDFGYINEHGHVICIDRMKDVIKLSDGNNFSPTFIENRLKFSPYIREAVAIGKDRPFVTALIQIDYAFVGAWAEKRQLAYTTFTDLARNEEVHEMISKEVDRVNSNLPEAARIKSFLLLDKELDADDEELTRTQKLRRAFVAIKYKQVIDSLYEGEN